MSDRLFFSVTFRHVFHTGWNTSKIISRLISLRFMLGLTPTWAILSDGHTPKLGWNRGWGHDSWAQKPAITLKRCKIRPRLLWRINRKSHMSFRLVGLPKSMILGDLQWPTRRHALLQKRTFTVPTGKMWLKIGTYYQRQNVGQWL